MQRLKDFIVQNKKIVFPVAILIVVFVAAGIYFISQSNAGKNKNADKQTQQTTEVSNSESSSENNTDESKTQGGEAESGTVDSGETQSGENSTGSQNMSGEDSDKVSDNGSGSDSANSGNSGGDNNTGNSSQGNGNSASGSGNGSGNSSDDWWWDFGELPDAHEHVWVTTTETKEETYTQWVTAEKKEYTLYKFYWHDTHKWEESRDHERFDEWYRSEYGGFFYAYHPYDKPEDDPLFIEYDSNGNPVYTNDHVIISNLFEWVPCEPYEKEETMEVTVTTTKCSVCGAVK